MRFSVCVCACGGVRTCVRVCVCIYVRSHACMQIVYVCVFGVWAHLGLMNSVPVPMHLTERVTFALAGQAEIGPGQAGGRHDLCLDLDVPSHASTSQQYVTLRRTVGPSIRPRVRVMVRVRVEG